MPLIPKMKKSGNHKIVHVSSISGDSLRGSAPYACSKNFLNSYIKTLQDLEKNVVVSGVMPGAIMEKMVIGIISKSKNLILWQTF